MRRTWLKDKYPKGIGLGDLLYEYESIDRNYDTESTLRRAEIRSVLDYIFKFQTTPEFSEKFGKFYL